MTLEKNLCLWWPIETLDPVNCQVCVGKAIAGKPNLVGRQEPNLPISEEKVSAAPSATLQNISAKSDQSI